MLLNDQRLETSMIVHKSLENISRKFSWHDWGFYFTMGMTHSGKKPAQRNIA